MSYRSLARFHRQARSRRRARARARAGLDRAGNDRNPDAPARRRRAGGAVRKADQGGRHALRHAVLVNLFGTVKRVAMGVTLGGERAHRRAVAARGGRAAGDAAPARAAAQPRRGDGASAAGQDRAGDEARRTRPGARLPGDRAGAATTSISSGLPIQTCWPGEPAPLITWPLVVTKGPGDAREDNFNLGIYRMQVTGRDTRPSCAG